MSPQQQDISQRASGGLTLSELVITIAMIGGLSAIAAPNMSRFLHKAKVEDALLRLQGALRETQNEAIRRNQSCTMTITPGVDQSISGDCLVTGDRPLKGIQVFHNSAGGASPWTVTFDSRGRNHNVDDKGTIVLTIPGRPNLAPQCLVLSIGIGLHRIGQYEGDITQKPAAKHCMTS